MDIPHKVTNKVAELASRKSSKKAADPNNSTVATVATVIDFEAESEGIIETKACERRNAGRLRRSEARQLFEKSVLISIDIERLRKWTDGQKTGFGQMLCIVLTKLSHINYELIGNGCKEVRDTADAVLEAR